MKGRFHLTEADSALIRALHFNRSNSGDALAAVYFGQAQDLIERLLNEIALIGDDYWLLELKVKTLEARFDRMSSLFKISLARPAPNPQPSADGVPK